MYIKPPAMKQKTNKSNPKKVTLLIVLSVLTLAAALVIYLYVFGGSFQNWSPGASQESSLTDDSLNNDVDSPATPSQIDDGTSIKEESINKDKQGGTSSSADVQVKITQATQNADLTGLRVRVVIQRLTSSGQCKLTVQSGSTTKVYTASVQALASTSTCKGFDIPRNELSPGQWNISVVYSDGKYSGSDSINSIEVK